ncbi:MAG: hypothetical protein AAGD40_11230, partial [Pseudomonadota bacterium]
MVAVSLLGLAGFAAGPASGIVASTPSAADAARYALSVAPEEDRNAWRWRLAVMESAAGRHAEALGIVAVISAADPARGEAAEVRRLRARALLATGRPAAALDVLGARLMAEDRDVTALRTRALSALGRHKDVLALPAIPDVAAQMARLRAAVLTDDSEAIRRALAATRNIAVPRHLAERAYWQGRLALRRGDVSTARRHFRAVEATVHPEAAVRARLGQIDVGLQDGTLAPAAALSRLTRLGERWRGGSTGDMRLYRTARLAAQNGDVKRVLATLTDLTTSDSPAVRELAARHGRDMLARALADPRRPVAMRFEIYWGARHQLPMGPDGDRRSAALAAELAEAGHGSQAALLYKHLLTDRLKDAARPPLAATLARLHLSSAHPEKALRALSQVRAEPVSDDLRLALARLEAAALADLGRHDEALAVLAADDRSEADRIRERIAWAQRLVMTAKIGKGRRLQPGERQPQVIR